MNRKLFPPKVFLLLFATFCIVLSLIAKDTPPKPPRGYPNHAFLKAAYALRLLKLVDRNPEIPDSIMVYKDLVYKRTKSRDLKLDVFMLKNIQQPRPLLIFIHGGGWKKGQKEDYLLYLIDFARRGYITATVSYRFSQEAHFPAAVSDVKCAVRWLRAHAKEYHIDPNKIAAIGGSAGGHLALMVGYTANVPELDGECEYNSVSSRVQAVVDLYGAVDLTTDFARKNASVLAFIGASYDEAAEKYRAASPINYVTPDDPPTLIFQGTIDKLVPVHQSDMLKEKLDKVGVPNEYHRLKGWPHTMDAAVQVNKYCQYYMNAFFEKHIPITK